MSLDDSGRERYARQLVLTQVGPEGQLRLQGARALIVGAGGLGCPVGFYLAAAGVGTIALIDSDRVELSNLQRQIAHRTLDIGRPKVESLRDALIALNPGLNIIPIEIRLGPDNVMELLCGYDLIIDATDNFPARFLINDACVLMDMPLVTGAVVGFEGQAMTIVPGRGHCYRCLFEAPPAEGAVPSPEQVGVLGVLPGVIGAIQATEAIKILLGVGDTLMGHMLIYDALSMNFRKIKLIRNPECAVCGERPTITSVGR